jgi:leader peptidase (prepilin peptidase)/N-methyltransferase
MLHEMDETPVDVWALLQRPSELPLPAAVLTLAWAFLFGACWGSFTNVVIARVPEGLSVVRPRSRCPKCGTQIAGYDNIPVLSWILLRGKCRACRAPISPRYPFIEFLVGLIAMALVARFGWNLHALELFTFATILVAIAFIDLDTWTVPDPTWIALIVSGIGFGVAGPALGVTTWDSLWERLIGGVGAGLAFSLLIVVFTGVLRRVGRIGPDDWAMGWGDPLILVGIGCYLGWRLLPLVVFLASVQGSVVGIVLFVAGGLKGDKPVSETDDWVPPKAAVPFGPFLALGAIEAAFFGDAFLARLFDGSLGFIAGG